MTQTIGRQMPRRISFDNNRFSKLEMTGQYSEDEDLTYQINKESQFQNDNEKYQDIQHMFGPKSMRLTKSKESNG